MVNILPIKFISESDQPFYGANLLNLAKLERNNFPVLPGFAVCSPQIILSTVLEHFKEAEKEVFNQRLEIVKRKIVKIPLPDEMKKMLGKEKSFYFSGKVFSSKEALWQSLLGSWLDEICNKLWQDGFNFGAAENLHPKSVFFIKNKFDVISAHFDPNLKEIVTTGEKLDSTIMKKIEELVTRADKRLFLPQVYTLINIKGRIYIVGISPFTQSLPVSKTPDIVMPKPQQKIAIKSAIKVFYNLSRGFAVPGSFVDGVLIDGEKIEDTDRGMFKLAEAALSFPGKPVIFKLPDISDGDVQGALRLIHQKSLLDTATQIFLYGRNKKNLLNVELGIPLVRTPDELVQIKQELSSRGINRKGTLRFWQEMAVPENLINLEDYLAVGIDGVILDLDRMQKHLGGYEIEEGEFYRKHVVALVSFIKPAFKVLHKARVPVVARGQLSIHPEVLDCLIENGVFGILANTEIEAESLPEHLSWSEKRMVVKRFTS